MTVDRRIVRTLVIAPLLVVTAYFACFAFAPDAFAWLLQGEAGAVELGTVVLFTLAGVEAGRAANAVGRRNALAVIFIGIAALAAFVVLEEVSYGQNFFGWSSPEYFARHNAQGETNLHNLMHSRPGHRLHRLADYGSLIAFVALPCLLAIAGAARSHVLVPGFELIALVALTRSLGFVNDLPGIAPDLNEVRELLWGWTLWGYLTSTRRRLRAAL